MIRTLIPAARLTADERLLAAWSDKTDAEVEAATVEARDPVLREIRERVLLLRREARA